MTMATTNSNGIIDIDLQQNIDDHGLSERLLGYLKPNATRLELETIPTPDHTQTWYPIPHSYVIDQVERSLESSGMAITASAFEVSHESLRMFGILQLESESTEYSLLLGVRNSHDKSFPGAIVLGSQVTVCSNLIFSGEIRITRKHTRFISRDFPGLVSRAVGQLHDKKIETAKRFEVYKDTTIEPTQVNDLVIAGLDNRVYGGTRIPTILSEFRNPTHSEFENNGLSVWRYFNAVTESLKGMNANTLVNRGERLHGILDSFCGLSA